MKQKTIFKILTLFFIPCFLYAHSPVLQIVDNEDGTIEVFGGFSTGQSAAGAKLKIKSAIDSKIIYENRVPKSGYLTIDIPKVPYNVILDSGPGHRIEKEGKISPVDGFDKDSSIKPLNIAFNTTLGLSILFILLSIYISIKNRRVAKR